VLRKGKQFRFLWVRVVRFVVFCAMPCRSAHCLLFCSFYFALCIVYPSSIYGFWIHLWYLQHCWVEWSVVYMYILVSFVSLFSQRFSICLLFSNWIVYRYQSIKESQRLYLHCDKQAIISCYWMASYDILFVRYH
jgi:hypothetical protein